MVRQTANGSNSARPTARQATNRSDFANLGTNDVTELMLRRTGCEYSPKKDGLQQEVTEETEICVSSLRPCLKLVIIRDHLWLERVTIWGR